MDLDKMVEIIPKLLLLIVPGFVSLRIKEKYSLEKKLDRFDSTLYSILYSFIIGILYSVLKSILSSIFKVNFLFYHDVVKQASYLILSVGFGYYLVKRSNSTLWYKITKCFNKNLSSEPSVWVKAMQNTNGTWATVYLKNGMIYTGKLFYYSTDPDDEEKAVLLHNYRLEVRKNQPVHNKEDFSCIIKDYTYGETNTKVYLDKDDIIAVEIQP